MKSMKIFALALTLVMLVPLFSWSAEANNAQTSAGDASFEASMQELYDDAMAYSEDYGLNGEVGYEAFREEYFLSGFDSIEDYRTTLFGLYYAAAEAMEEYAAAQADGSVEEANEEPSSAVLDPEERREGLEYSEEILQTYENMSDFMAERGAVLEISVDDFAARYEGPEVDYFALYCNVPVSEG
mgnify:FL=1